MTEKPPVEETATVTDAVTFASLAMKFLGLLERVLPAFLVAWNNQLRQRAKEAELKLEHAETKLAVEAKKDELEKQDAGKTDRAIIDDFLRK